MLIKEKDRKLSQPQLAALLCERGLDVKAHSISKWEKNVNLPNILQFFALCEILEISDINRTFQIGTDEKLFSKLNDEGQAKVLDYMNLFNEKWGIHSIRTNHLSISTKNSQSL